MVNSDSEMGRQLKASRDEALPVIAQKRLESGGQIRAKTLAAAITPMLQKDSFIWQFLFCLH